MHVCAVDTAERSSAVLKQRTSSQPNHLPLISVKPHTHITAHYILHTTKPSTARTPLCCALEITETNPVKFQSKPNQLKYKEGKQQQDGGAGQQHQEEQSYHQQRRQGCREGRRQRLRWGRGGRVALLHIIQHKHWPGAYDSTK